MAKKRKLKWEKKECGCVKTRLSIGRVLIRCRTHRGKPTDSGRILCYVDDDGRVRQEDRVE